MHRTHHHARRWLPGLNFFLADVRDGLGPFLGVFLLAQGWRLDDIGYVMALGGIAGMLATTPLGALSMPRAASAGCWQRPSPCCWRATWPSGSHHRWP